MDPTRKVEAECLATRMVLHRLIRAMADKPDTKDVITAIQASTLAAIIDANGKVSSNTEMRDYGDAVLKAASDLFSPLGG